MVRILVIAIISKVIKENSVIYVVVQIHIGYTTKNFVIYGKTPIMMVCQTPAILVVVTHTRNLDLYRIPQFLRYPNREM